MEQALNPPSLDLATHGARLYRSAAVAQLTGLTSTLADVPRDDAGVRISGLTELAPFLASGGVIGSIAAGVLGTGSRPVRAILFDKTEAMNWSLPWHQDRTICVKYRVEVSGYGPWTIKAGLHHVAPPFELLERMVTLRVHLDGVDTDNAPLLIALGSHRLGIVPAGTADKAASGCVLHTCLAEPGDVWLYATPILHASKAAAKPTRRRVLQVDYAASELPGALEWLGV